MYERLAKSDGADAQGLRDYVKLIQEQHPWAIRYFRKRYN